MTQPNLVLLPWARRGGAVRLPPDDPHGHPASQVSTTAEVVVNGAGPPASVPVQLLGPGDVTGLAPQQVIRTDPAPGARTFESNYFALVEFDEPALPWLFTPASAVAGRLRPWLCLVVVRQQPGVELTPPTKGALPVLRIGAPARPEDELPDLAESWAWAHAQLATDAVMSDAALSAALGGDPARSLSRLVSGRLLAEQTEYLACVVPTFEAGRLTGLGDDPGSVQGPAWQLAVDMLPVELPVLHSWRFATGPSGDFQSLALAIRGRVLPDDFGVRPVDLSTSGLDLTGVDDAQVLLGGALLALDAPAQRWTDPSLPARFAAALTGVLNAPDHAPAAEALLAPPRYGSTYRSAPAGSGPALDQAAVRWYEQLNLDPANRIAAALGTLVVQRQQETLVAAAWDQAADLNVAQRLYGLAGFGLALAESLHRRYLEPLPAEAGLFVLAPLRARLLQAPAMGTNPSFGDQWAATRMPEAALGAAFRRVARTRGPALRRASRVTPLPGSIDVLGKMAPSSRIERVVVPPVGRLTFEEVGALLPNPLDLSWAQVNPDAITGAPTRAIFQLAPMPRPEGPPRPLPSHAGPGGGVLTPVLLARRRPTDPDEPFPEDPEPPEPDPEPDPDPHHPPRPDNEVAQAFRQVAARHLAAFLPTTTPGGTAVGVLDAGTLFAEAKAVLAPARTFTAQVAGMLTGPMPDPTDTPIPALTFTPRFDTPMVRALTELGQQWLLPGLDGVPANTAVALRTNGAFVESFLIGLNHEFGRELLWREFPTPLTATFFERFWDAAVAPDAPPDIPALDTWADRFLGEPTVVADRLVFLLRSELMRRFPDALVSLVRNSSPPEQLMPVFRGSLDPDITFFGFAVPLDSADEYSIVIAEQPGAPRFGFEVGQAPPGVSHAPATGATSAQVAAGFRQLPARITIPISVLLRKPVP
ncbi:MAG TPA: hypothetical protein VGK18_17455 [Propionicimonas sp.]|uniref:hypothetical protein n=1 Tax=Propionicimonas sp. TaxID=1955623 RepID=UPI002F400F96